MTIVRLMLSTAALGLAMSLVQPSEAQPGGGKRRPYPGADLAGGMRPYPGADQGRGGKRGPGGKRGRPEGAGPPGSDDDEPGMHGKRKGDRRAERKARHEELKQKESDGKLTDDEKQELDKIERVHKRHGALKGKHEQRGKNRKMRRRAARRQAIAEFPGLLKNNDALAEYGKHGQRMAQLERAREVAEAEGMDDLVKRIDALMAKEKQRHQNWVAKHKGGQK